MSGPRVRFAPSPTGYFHVGSARTALFNWFVARQSPDGVFLLRIEDTDADRNREEWVDGIVAAMHWLGFDPDEGPFRQTDNTDAHRAAVEDLFRGGYLYPCACTSDEVALRKGDNKTPGYDGYCRDRDVPRGPTTGLRFRTPREGATIVHDKIRGDVVTENAVIEDFVVARSSGAALFALANVVDDRNDRITHVIRGEEHLPNTPKQILLWEALSTTTGVTVPIPEYAHLPILVNEQRKKLSKRRDPVAVESYRDAGYLPAAILNYLSLLGWSPRGDEEKVPLSVCIEQFRLEDVSHSPAFFDLKKMAHMNGEYIRELSPEDFLAAAAPWVTPWTSKWQPTEGAPPWTQETFDFAVWEAVAPLVQERVALMGEIVPMIEFFFVSEAPFDEAAFDKTIRNDDKARELLSRSLDVFGDCEWTSSSLHAAVVALGETLELNLRKAQAPVRCAVTGKTVGPPLFESLELLGRERTLQRVREALAKAGG